jgi:hypothetical protein
VLVLASPCLFRVLVRGQSIQCEVYFTLQLSFLYVLRTIIRLRSSPERDLVLFCGGYYFVAVPCAIDGRPRRHGYPLISVLPTRSWTPQS